MMDNRIIKSQRKLKLRSIEGRLLAIYIGKGFSFEFGAIYTGSNSSGFTSLVDSQVKKNPPIPKPAIMIPEMIPSRPGK